MSIIKVDYGSVSGGGNIHTDTGTFSATNTSYPIDTGLSSVSKFVLVHKGNAYTTLNTVLYDADVFSDKYVCYSQNNATAIGPGSAKNVGTSPGGSFSQCAWIESISGGTVTVKSPDNVNFVPTDFWWVAE